MNKFYLTLFLVAAIFFIPQYKLAAQSAEPALEFTCQPYLQNLHQKGITVSWSVSLNSTSRVEYGETDQLGSKAVHSQAGMIDVGSGVQKVVLTNLKPGTRYYYCVVSKEVKTLLAYKVVYGDS
ncbi:MAG: fibronectin type III domain-containing protein, partial [Bacteroidota bacterium]|nr:fibronectin type III domain-containing protein [Bacteroidota bacterium]